MEIVAMFCGAGALTDHANLFCCPLQVPVEKTFEEVKRLVDEGKVGGARGGDGSREAQKQCNGVCFCSTIEIVCALSCGCREGGHYVSKELVRLHVPMAAGSIPI
jgi:hypothetical protein